MAKHPSKQSRQTPETPSSEASIAPSESSASSQTPQPENSQEGNSEATPTQGFSARNKDLRNLGSIYTPPEIANYLASWAVVAPTATVLDLGVGDGVFVWAAYRRLQALGTPATTAPSQIYGAEVYEPAYKGFVQAATSQNVTFPYVVNEDFLTYEFPQVDAIVGNPPYVRRQYLDDIDLLRQRVSDKFPDAINKLSRLADLYIYFLLRATAFLKEGGRLAVIVADPWLGVNYGREFKEFLKANFDIERVINFDRRIFDADVKPVMLLATKRTAASKRKNVEFIRVQNGLPIQTLSQNTKKLERHKDIHVTKIRQNRLDAKQIWHRHFSDDDVIRELSSHNLMANLSDQAYTRIGIQTLAKDFFVLTPEVIQQRGIERDYIRPMVHSIRTVDQIVVEPGSDPSCYLFICGKGKPELAGTRALQYIEQGETTPVKVRGKNKTVIGYNNKERIQRDWRAYWYDLEGELNRRGSATILIPRLIYKDLYLVWNKAKYVPGELFIEVILPEEMEEETKTYLAVLSSSISEIMMRTSSQVYGGGTYNISPGLVKSAPILDVRRLSDTQKRQLHDAYTSYLDDDHRDKDGIDKVIYDVLGIDVALRKRIKTLLEDMQSGKEKLHHFTKE